MIPNDITTMPARSMTVWERIKTFDPALLRAVLIALGVILGTIGVDLSDVFGKIEVAYLAFFGVVPLLQGWWTRSAVTPAARVVESVDVNGVVVAGPASPQPTGQVLRLADEK